MIKPDRETSLQITAELRSWAQTMDFEDKMDEAQQPVREEQKKQEKRDRGEL